MSDQLKLYVWEGVLFDINPSGVMFALASSIEEARDIILKKADESGAVQRQDSDAYHDPVWRDLQDEPQVFNIPVGFIVWGGQ